MKNRTRNTRKGFTLIELLVVVLILGILTAIALPSYLSSVKASKEAAANTNAKAIATAVQAYGVANNGYPAALTTTGSFATDMGGGIPANPCGTNVANTVADYNYTVTGLTATVAAASSNSDCSGWTGTVYSLAL